MQTQEAVVVGLDGEIARGGKAIGLHNPCALSVAAITYGIDLNSEYKSFKLKVNPFNVAIAREAIALRVSRMYNVSIEVEGVGGFSKDSWRLEPQE